MASNLFVIQSNSSQIFLSFSSYTPGADSTTDAVSGTVGEEEEHGEEEEQAKSNKTKEASVESNEEDEDLFDALEEVNPRSLPEPRKKNHFKCTECDKICRNAWLLDRHKKARHNNIDEVAESGKTCPYCKRVFLAGLLTCWYAIRNQEWMTAWTSQLLPPPHLLPPPQLLPPPELLPPPQLLTPQPTLPKVQPPQPAAEGG